MDIPTTQHRASGWRGRMARTGTALLLLGLVCPVPARAELFDFDTAPIHTALPIDLTVGQITAHFTATGQGFAIQPANTMGFTPVGFGGLCIYPSSVFAADLLISFSVALSDFSIMYAPQELGCDDSAIMRITAYLNGTAKGTATTTAPQPGTWPVGTLSYSDPNGFDQVVIHYDRRPACGDWGPIFMADNMDVTASTASVPPRGARPQPLAVPNPFRHTTELHLLIDRTGPLTVTVHDANGRLVRTLASGDRFEAGPLNLTWDGRDDGGALMRSGLYFCRVTNGTGERTTRVILRR